MTPGITTFLIIIALLAILYTIFKKCWYVSSLPWVCFPLYPFSTILRGTARTDIFVEVVNLASAEAMWAHFASMAVHPSQLRITGYPRAYNMHIIKLCCCRQLQFDWQNIVLCDLDRCTVIKVPHPKREGGQVILLQNYPHPLSLRDRGPYHFPTSLNT